MEKVNDEIFSKVNSIISEQLKIPASKEVKLHSSLDELGADSLDRVEIIMKLEEVFNIEISDEEAEKLTTLGNIVNFIKKSKDH